MGGLLSYVRRKPEEPPDEYKLKAVIEVEKALKTLIDEDHDHAKNRNYLEGREKLKALRIEAEKLADASNRLKSIRNKYEKARTVLAERKELLLNAERSFTDVLINNSETLLGIKSTDLKADLLYQLRELLNEAKQLSKAYGAAESAWLDAQLSLSTAIRRFDELPQLRIDSARTNREHILNEIEYRLVDLDVAVKGDKVADHHGQIAWKDDVSTKFLFDKAKADILKLVTNVNRNKMTVPTALPYKPPHAIVVDESRARYDHSIANILKRQPERNIPSGTDQMPQPSTEYQLQHQTDAPLQVQPYFYAASFISELFTAAFTVPLTYTFLTRFFSAHNTNELDLNAHPWGHRSHRRNSFYVNHQWPSSR